MTEAPSGPRVVRVGHASLRSSDKRLRVTLRVTTAPRRERRAHCELDKHRAKALYRPGQSRAQLVLCCGSRRFINEGVLVNSCAR